MLEHEMEAPNQHTEEELEAAYQAGYLACHDEQGLDTNPYPVNSILWQQYKAGWQHYDADYNPEYYSARHFSDL